MTNVSKVNIKKSQPAKMFVNMTVKVMSCLMISGFILFNLSAETDASQLNVAIEDCGPIKFKIEKYLDFSKYLAENIGASGASLKFPKNGKELDNWIKNGKVQLVICKLANYLAWRDMNLNIKPLVTPFDESGSNTFTGLFIARKDKNIMSFDDMKGTHILFGSKGAFEKYEAAVYTLLERDIDPKNFFKKISHGTKCPVIGKYVFDGGFDVGLVSDYTWGPILESKIDLSKMRIVGKTVPIPYFVLFGANLDDSQMEKIIALSTNFSDTKVLSKMRFSEFRKFNDGDLKFLDKINATIKSTQN